MRPLPTLEKQVKAWTSMEETDLTELLLQVEALEIDLLLPLYADPAIYQLRDLGQVT